MRHHLHLLLALLLIGLLTACTVSGPAAPEEDASQQQDLPFDIDPATMVVVDYRRSGGLAGLDEHAQLFLDGRVVLERRGQAPVTFQATPEEVAQINAAFEATDFHRQARREELAQAEAGAAGASPPVRDGFQYEITRNGVLVQTTLHTADGVVPAWAQSLIDLLNSLLLTARPDTGAAQAPDQTAQAQDASARLVLVSFRRSGGLQGLDDRVLVHLDRSYSVARRGVVEAGRLTEEEMANLLRLLEAADLQERQGEYLPDDACCDLFSYELTYRNPQGLYQVRAMDGATPDWLQVIVDTMTAAFIEAEPLAAAPGAPQPAAPPPTLAATPDSTTAAPTEAEAAPLATSAAPPTATETLTTTAPTSYGLADLLADLVAAGATVEQGEGRIAEPFLSVLGVIVWVDGEPVQAFEYPDAAALATDVAGLARDASQIDDIPLVWAASPHFWRRDRVLALAMSDNLELIEAVSGVMGAQFAGR